MLANPYVAVGAAVVGCCVSDLSRIGTPSSNSWNGRGSSSSARSLSTTGSHSSRATRTISSRPLPAGGAGIIEWVRAKWRAFTDLIPDFVKRGLGIKVDVEERRPQFGAPRDGLDAFGGAGETAPVPAARRLSPGALGGRGRPMDGRLLVEFRNTPATTRITREQKRSDEISLDVDAGFLMGGA